MQKMIIIESNGQQKAVDLPSGGSSLAANFTVIDGDLIVTNDSTTTLALTNGELIVTMA